MPAYVPGEVTVVFQGNPIKATSVSVSLPRAEVVDVTGVTDTIGRRALVSTGDKVGGATIQVNGFLEPGQSFAASIGQSATLTISGPQIAPVSSPNAILVAADEPIQFGQLRTVSLTFMVEYI